MHAPAVPHRWLVSIPRPGSVLPFAPPPELGSDGEVLGVRPRRQRPYDSRSEPRRPFHSSGFGTEDLRKSPKRGALGFTPPMQMPLTRISSRSSTWQEPATNTSRLVGDSVAAGRVEPRHSYAIKCQPLTGRCACRSVALAGLPQPSFRDTERPGARWREPRAKPGAPSAIMAVWSPTS